MLSTDLKKIVSDMKSGAGLNAELDTTDLRRVVLLIEPCPGESVRLRNELVTSRIEVHTATDLITASHALSLVQPNLILAQLRLPTFSGLDLVRRLKEDHATRLIPVILYSDIATAEERVQALDLGAVDLLTKPFVTPELIARVRAALKTRHTLSVLERRAHIDSLTGLANRTVFEDQLLREWDIWHRRKVPLSLIIADLDHFKTINDMYGHAAGDTVLHQAAQMLANSVRDCDLVARYGGEEFVVIAPNCSPTVAVTLCRKFRSNLTDQMIPTQDVDIRVTASVGIATTDRTQRSPAELLQQADIALYRAKSAGRDAIWIYDSSGERQSMESVPALSPTRCSDV